MWKRLKQIKDRLDPVVVVVTFFVSMISALLTGIVYVNTYVEASLNKAIDDRIRPYERYLSANSNLINGGPDECLDEVLPIFQEIDAPRYRQLSKVPFYNVVIACARNSSSPGRHMSLITRIERKLNEGEIPSRAWHSASLGWYHLRVGERERAKRHFQRAISLLSNEGDFIEEAETHFGMTLVHLLEADPAAAAQEYQRAGTLSPVQYPLASAEAPVLARLNGRDLSHLRNNPNMQTSMSDFVARLRAMASAQ